MPLFWGAAARSSDASSLGDELFQPAGSELITEGVKGREFFVLIDGSAEARRKGRRVATFEAADFFGRSRCSRSHRGRRPSSQQRPCACS